MWKKGLVTALLVAFTMGCSTTTIKRKGTAKLVSDPSYSDSKSFFLWGLVGTSHVDVSDVCDGKSAVQIQSQDTFLDSFLTIITIGIYAPRTAKVWCEGSEGTKKSKRRRRNS